VALSIKSQNLSGDLLGKLVTSPNTKTKPVKIKQTSSETKIKPKPIVLSTWGDIPENSLLLSHAMQLESVEPLRGGAFKRRSLMGGS
jgi:hypothetical protein